MQTKADRILDIKYWPPGFRREVEGAIAMHRSGATIAEIEKAYGHAIIRAADMHAWSLPRRGEKRGNDEGP